MHTSFFQLLKGRTGCDRKEDPERELGIEGY